MQAVAPGAEDSCRLVAGGKAVPVACCAQAMVPAESLIASWHRSDSCATLARARVRTQAIQQSAQYDNQGCLMQLALQGREHTCSV